MFADDTTLDTSDTDPVSVENQLQKGINTVSDGCRKNAMVLHLKKKKKKTKKKKTKGMLLATREKEKEKKRGGGGNCPFNLNLKTDLTEQGHKH